MKKLAKVLSMFLVAIIMMSAFTMIPQAAEKMSLQEIASEYDKWLSTTEKAGGKLKIKMKVVQDTSDGLYEDSDSVKIDSDEIYDYLDFFVDIDITDEGAEYFDECGITVDESGDKTLCLSSEYTEDYEGTIFSEGGMLEVTANKFGYIYGLTMITTYSYEYDDGEEIYYGYENTEYTAEIEYLDPFVRFEDNSEVTVNYGYLADFNVVYTPDVDFYYSLSGEPDVASFYEYDNADVAISADGNGTVKLSIVNDANDKVLDTVTINCKFTAWNWICYILFFGWIWM